MASQASANSGATNSISIFYKNGSEQQVHRFEHYLIEPEYKTYLSSPCTETDVSQAHTADGQVLSGWKATMFSIALLAPKLLCSGAGWTVGFMLGGNLGAAAGDALGTALGCTISLGIELALRKFVLKDPTLDGNTKELLKIRLGQGLILCAGAFVGGLMFNPAYKWTSQISNSTLHSLAASAITSLGFVSGMQAARAAYTAASKYLGNVANDHFKLSAINLKNDLILGASIIFGAETAFYGTVAPLFSTKVFMGQNFMIEKGAGAVALGGELGLIAHNIGEKVVSTAQWAKNRCFSAYNSLAA